MSLPLRHYFLFQRKESSQRNDSLIRDFNLRKSTLVFSQWKTPIRLVGTPSSTGKKQGLRRAPRQVVRKIRSFNRTPVTWVISILPAAVFVNPKRRESQKGNLGSLFDARVMRVATLKGARAAEHGFAANVYSRFDARASEHAA